MVSEKMFEALNKQLNAELYSAYMYLSMAAYFESKSLNGFANWMKAQAAEEVTHGMKFYDYISERGGRVKMMAIDEPPTEWESPFEAFKAVYNHEVKVSGLINNLVDLALEEKDHMTYNFLQWFVAEQVEEESSADEIVQKLKLAGKEGSGLFLMDRELGTRAFPSTAFTGGKEEKE